ncbi:glycoside hydrolase family 2 protein [Kribbella sp.]|uniref:glycoside hydrolase family 2 protein n=1 Tax=Kribbella sp. TaxID=1871183 RepID=UPI002D31A79A|nr:glycoside hydrolase family 2 TIM barrel-domain containing protein [Kribbella sp.]HZX06126.1 glycoside hydrolase family 2 TIM barrel-domain containing protein [Kribbella sp.]
MDEWRFGRLTAEAAVTSAYDDSGFAVVTLPHTVVPLSWRDWDADSWDDRWCYRRWVDVPADAQRVFVDVDGALHAASVYVNGQLAGSQEGGYLAHTYEVTSLVRPGANLVAVVLDARWLPIPPNGHPDGHGAVDYYQPGGLSRSVEVRFERDAFISDLYTRPLDVLDPIARRVEVTCAIDGPGELASVELRTADGRVIAEGPILRDLGDVQLWSPDSPVLYDVVARLGNGSERSVRIGFREARFEVDGFYLNGTRVELFGLNRHQIFPWTGMAMPDRVQRRDAEILRNELNCTMVRCAHYPQSPAFLDACDELGLLVFEEIPGWQYVGDAAWQDRAVADVERMIRRDRNRPSVVVWGVRVNESANYPELYRRTQDAAKALDPDRATSGAMVAGEYSTNDFHQDVFAYNDYAHDESGATLLEPLPGIPYLVTEAIGSLAGPHFYRRTDPQSVQARQAFLHAQVHQQAAVDDRYLGVVAWQAFDYDSENGWVDHRLKCNGVADTFRIPKLGAAIYQAQVPPARRPVIAPAFYWDGSAPDELMICSNSEWLEVFLDGDLVATVRPDTERFGGLRYPPSFLTLPASRAELRIDGYVDGRQVITRTFSAEVARLQLVADDTELVADGTDLVRVVLQATDAHGNPLPAVGTVTFDLAGPAELVGDTTFPLESNGGAVAVWLRAHEPGPITLTAKHPNLGTATATVTAV